MGGGGLGNFKLKEDITTVLNFTFFVGNILQMILIYLILKPRIMIFRNIRVVNESS